MSRRPTGSAPRVGLDDRLARVALSRLAEPGDLRMNTLVTDLGPVAVHEHLTSQRDLHGLLDDVGQRLEALDPERELVQAEERGIRFVVPGDPEWPAGLDDLRSADPLHDRGGVPIGLWVRGPLRLDELAGGVAVVGSRSSTTYGESVARDIAARVSLTGLTAVSGAAFGIDQAAHRGALASGAPTAAVLACGADRSYPAAHSTLLDHIATVGAVVSETAPGLPPTRIRFLSRNRLIA
ncbi:DNA-processing protein DprA, partial [Nocardioides kribbensis]|uniref:DNA-processing protein DprA n=1 Tax=Nocardioides kribbensis TaxID=305517 RepID=UPI0032D9F4B6